LDYDTMDRKIGVEIEGEGITGVLTVREANFLRVRLTSTSLAGAESELSIPSFALGLRTFSGAYGVEAGKRLLRDLARVAQAVEVNRDHLPALWPSCRQHITALPVPAVRSPKEYRMLRNSMRKSVRAGDRTSPDHQANLRHLRAEMDEWVTARNALLHAFWSESIGVSAGTDVMIRVVCGIDPSAVDLFPA
jgi:hypothetical protein